MTSTCGSSFNIFATPQEPDNQSFIIVMGPLNLLIQAEKCFIFQTKKKKKREKSVEKKHLK